MKILNAKPKSKGASKKIISLVYDNDIVKNLNLFLRMKRDIIVTNKKFSSGKISDYTYNESINKIKKERQFLKDNVDFFEEILFETEDCTLSCVFENKSIKYCINQYGMKDYYNSLEKAIINFVRISL